MVDLALLSTENLDQSPRAGWNSTSDQNCTYKNKADVKEVVDW